MGKFNLLAKILVVGGLCLLLCLPLGLIGGLVSERAASRDSVREDVAKSLAGPQTLAGPVLVLPYRQRVVDRVESNNGWVGSERWEAGVKYRLPETLTADAGLENQPRSRGIYQVQTYQSHVLTRARFQLGAEDVAAREDIQWGQPYLVFGLSDVRGIVTTPALKVNGREVAVAAGSSLAAFESGLHALLDPPAEGALDVEFTLDLRGMESLQFLPLGRDSRFSLHSPWPHPSFFGRYLPETHKIGKNGFTASWRSTFLASNMEALFTACLNGQCGEFRQNGLGVKLIEPVDVYLQVERASKYGFLFIVLTFVTFLLFELLKDLRIHPVQYTLVGAALVLFFLLLLSLAEHIPFAVAYGVAAATCIGLLSFYISHVLHSLWRGLGFGALLTALFAALYGLLRSEDYALLMGSLLLLLVIAVVMAITRRLDWYSLGAPQGRLPQEQEGVQ